MDRSHLDADGQREMPAATLQPTPALPGMATASTLLANILIVDDRPDKLLVFRTILEELQQTIVCVQSGEEALRWLLDNEAAVILLDVNMPGMDSFETAELIRARRRSAHTPIIFITAHADEILSARGYSLGAVDYLLSPAAPNVLRSKVSAFVQLFNLTKQIQRQADEHIVLVREQTARSAAEESTRRANFVADAGKLMISSLNVEALMTGTTQLLVPSLADFCAMSVIHNATTVTRTAAVGSTDDAAVTSALSGESVLAVAIADVIASGHQRRVDNPLSCAQSGGPSTSGASDKSRPADNGTQPASPFSEALVLPLIARGQVHGTLTLAMGASSSASASSRRFDAPRLALANEIASRAALALDNCLLFKEIRDNDRRKDEFLATLSHELRNPLAPMRTAIHAVNLAGGWPPEAQKLSAMLERQLDHLTRLVDDLLDVSRITQGKIHLRTEAVDLTQNLVFALENCHTQIKSAGHSVVRSLPTGPVMVDGDRVRLQQIFENLIVNACRYTDPGGIIDVALEVDGESARFRIRDTGVGISPEMLPRIFDMFAQADSSTDRTRHGLGIGLALVRKLVELHGGTVSAKSEGLKRGSEFTVTLPTRIETTAARADATTSANTTAIPEALGDSGDSGDSGPIRILVVDDNVDAAESMSVLLGLFGHHVEVAHDGPAAIAIANGFRPHLVFLDIGLPGMDGYEVAQALRDRAGLVNGKFIALSGYGTENDKRRSREAGFIDHLVKPLNPRELPGIISSATAEP